MGLSYWYKSFNHSSHDQAKHRSISNNELSSDTNYTACRQSTSAVNAWLFAVLNATDAVGIEDVTEYIDYTIDPVRHLQVALLANKITASLLNHLLSTIYSTDPRTDIAILIERVKQKLIFSFRAAHHPVEPAAEIYNIEIMTIWMTTSKTTTCYG